MKARITQQGVILIGESRSFLIAIWRAAGGKSYTSTETLLQDSRAVGENLADIAVEAMGLPVPALWDVEQVGDRWGVIFDRVEGSSIADRIRSAPQTAPDPRPPSAPAARHSLPAGGCVP